MRYLFLTALLAAGAASAREELPLDHFIKHPKFLDVKISPTGEYLAATIMETEDTGGLVVIRRSDRAITGTMKLAGRNFVSGFAWVNDERIVLSVAEKDGSLSNPRGTGELYATNWDGKNQQLLIGGRAQSGLEAAKRKMRWEGAGLVDDLAGDDKNVIVQVWGLGDEEGAFPSLERLNVYTGSRTKIARSPVRNSFFTTDAAGEVRFVQGDTTDNRAKLYRRDGGKWTLINDEAESGLRMFVVGLHADGRRAILQSEQETGPDALYTFDPATGAKTLLARHEVADPASFVYDRLGVTPVAAVYMHGGPSVKVLDKGAAEVALLRQLIPSFPGEWVSLRSYSEDGNLVVFSVSSDRNPGSFYLFDRAAKKAEFLLSGADWIDPEKMASMQPVEYTARDGVKIHGYLTLPPGSSGKNLPLIVNPHGGPFGPYDDWSYNREVQLFANRGYAVLQVNFRGSGNYGRAFQRLGYRQWGGTMQDDLTDATKWAIAQGIADADRICIYGASYGGYASAMGLAKEPGLYRCGVGYVGVYDMQMMYTRGDIQDRDSGLAFLEEALGGGKENLAKRSPTALASRIEAPMMIVVGNDDVRAHPDHSKAMRRALEKAGKQVEWLEKDYEGHGFFKEENNRELYTRMLAFFEKHIGKGEGAASRASSP